MKKKRKNEDNLFMNPRWKGCAHVALEKNKKTILREKEVWSIQQ